MYYSTVGRGILEEMKEFIKTNLTVPFGKEAAWIIVELFSTHARASLVSVDQPSRKVTLHKFVERPAPAPGPKALAQLVAELVASFNWHARTQVVVSLSHASAAIVHGTIALSRSDPKADITQAELENLISQGLWRLYTDRRGEVAAHMGVTDAAIALADADILTVRLDGHRVVNPVGFTARTVEFCCRQTFVISEVYQALLETLTGDNLQAIVEGPALWVSLFARLRPAPQLFIYVGSRQSFVYTGSEQEFGFIDSFAWGTQALLTGVGSAFGVSATDARTLLDRYAAREASSRVLRAISASASGELAMLANGIASHQPASPVPVFVFAPLPLPEVLFDPSFARRLQFKTPLTAVNAQLIAEKFRFVLQLPRGLIVDSAGYTFDSVLAIVVDRYSTSNLSMINRTAKQRVRWAKYRQESGR